MTHDIFLHAGMFTLAIVFAIFAGAVRVHDDVGFTPTIMLALALAAVFVGMFIR